MSARDTAGSIALVVASLIAVLLALEAGLYVVQDEPAAGPDESELLYRSSPDPERVYELIPGRTGRASGTIATINADGHRGRQGAKAPFEGTRTLVIGDSITFGHGLAVEQSFPELLHTELQASDTPHEVLNFGVPGYDTLQEVAYLETLVADYRPDRVVLGFCLNDAGIVTIPVQELLDRSKEPPLWRSSRALVFIQTKVMTIARKAGIKQQNELEVLRERYAGQIDAIGDDEKELRQLMDAAPDILGSAWFKTPERVGRLRYAFRRLAALQAQYGFETTVVIFPALRTSDGDYPHRAAHGIVALLAEESGFAVIDMLDDYLDAGMENLLLEDSDYIHPNAEGHRLAAQALLRAWDQPPEAAQPR